MDFSALFESLQANLGETLPSLLSALAILVVGWLLALGFRAGSRRVMRLAGLNGRISSSTGNDVDAEHWLASIVYYVVLALTLVGVFNALELQQLSGSVQALVDQILAFAPKLLAGGLILGVAWVLASAVRGLATRALGATTLDDRLSVEAGMRPPSESLASVLYWLVILVFLPAVLGALEMGGLLEPVRGMVESVLATLPDIFGALVIGLAGWFVARILRDLVSNLLSASGVDAWGGRLGLQGNTTVSGLLGLLVYIFILVPALIAALDTLQIDAISVPAQEMLGAFMDAIPNVFAAGLILVVAYTVASFVSDLSSRLLAGAGFDLLPERLGLGALLPTEERASSLVGRLIVFFVMLFGTVEAANRLGFQQVSGLVGMMIDFAGQVLLGLVIMAVGFWISNMARAAVVRLGGDGSTALAGVARFGILGLVLAMGLRAMGLADDIVNLAFGLTLGAVAIAFALSFGLGGREAAGRQMEHWLSQLRER